MSYNSVNPYTGELLRHFPEHTNAEMDEALHGADACFRKFGTLPERTAVLTTAAKLILNAARGWLLNFNRVWSF